MPISVVIITKNEGENIGRCLEAAFQVTDDVVIADSNSDDDTISICQNAGAKVFQLKWRGYAKTKNHANTLASNNWILSIDADEVLSSELIQTIQQLHLQDGHVYLLDRICNYCGDWIRHSGWYPDWKPRIFNRTTTQWTGDFVHEKLTFPINTRMVRIKGKLFHYSYKSQEDHLARIEKYAQLSAHEMYINKKAVPSQIMIWLKSWARFLRTYVLKMGFLDGKNGWLISKRNAGLVRLKYKKLKALYNQ